MSGNSTIQSQTAPLVMTNDGTSFHNNVFKSHHSLVQWVQANGGYLYPDVELVFSPEKGYHARVAEGKTIPAMTRIASCPMASTMSVLNALDTAPFESHGTRFPNVFLDKIVDTPESLQTFFLMEQFVLGDKSWWAPYIKTLPTLQDVQNLQFENGDDLVWLEGTNLKAGFATQMKKWQDMYTRGVDDLKRLKWPSAINGKYSWEIFRWAATMFGSRSFSSDVLADTLPADRARPAGRHDGHYPHLVKLFSEKFAVLLPLADLLNHNPTAQIEWQARYSFVGLQVLENHDSCQELFNNYGPKDNEGLLLAYGFAIQDNPSDHLVISLKVPPGSPLEVARTWNKDTRSDYDHRCFLFSVEHPRAQAASWVESSVFSFDLLDSLSVLSGNDREVQTMFMRKKTLLSHCLSKVNNFEDSRNILSTLSQLLSDCEARAKRLRATDPEQKNPPQQPRNQKQHFAKIYRTSQSKIVDTAIAVVRFTLVRACFNHPDDQIFNIVRNDTSPKALEGLQTILNRHKFLITVEELLTYKTLLSMLPTATSDSLQKCVQDLGTNLKLDPSHSTAALDGISLAKGRLALLLAVFCVEYARGVVKLPQRLKTWIKQLSEWYPPDDENWTYVPHPGPWAPGEDPPPALMAWLAARAAMSPQVSPESNVKQWLKPEMICWGWNVMEEECVRLPPSVWKLVSHEKESSESLGVVLYCKQY